MIRQTIFPAFGLALLVAWLVGAPTGLSAQQAKRVVFVAGPPSHGYGAHEHFAGCRLLADALAVAMPNFQVEVVRHQWPPDAELLSRADALVIYSDGGPGHPAIPHHQQVDRLAARGGGIVCLHYAVEVPRGADGDRMMRWIGGYFETDWSVNPHWRADFDELPDHEITRGVEPFESQDEWYFHMRFVPEMVCVTPILSAVPPASTMERPDGPHSGNPHVRRAVARGERQVVAWATERPDGGRGFGFTGGHFHWNWADQNFRRLVLNAIVWSAGGEVPESGVAIERIGLATLQAHQDFPVPDDFDPQQIQREQPDLRDDNHR